MADTGVAPASSTPPVPVRSPRVAALASWIGSVLEYYDFFIYGTASALVFNKVFFPTFSPATGLLLSLATFGVGYVARPLGAFVLGHFGDVVGRKKVLLFTVVMMGVSTFLVGCVPSYDQIGVAAPIIIVALRVLQGISAAGEQSGATSMTMEHAPNGQRGYLSSWTLSGTLSGNLLATLVFIPVATMPQEQLLAWGWRIPFLLSAAVLFVGIWMRRRLPETPEFERERVQRKQQRKLPLVILLREYPGAVVRVILASLIVVVSTIFNIYALAFATNVVHLDRAPMLTMALVTNVVGLICIPLWGKLSDRIGRKPVFLLGTIGSAVLVFAFLGSIASGNWGLIFLFGILQSGVVYHAANAIGMTFYGEMFSTKVRLSGTAIGTQIGFAVGGFAPTIAAAVGGTGPDGWVAVATFTAACCIVSAIAALTAKETHRLELDQLGARPPHKGNRASEDVTVATASH